MFDLDAGPMKITMPDSGDRFVSLFAIDEDHYIVDVAHGAGEHSYTKAGIGTRYLFVATRTLVDPTDADDLAQAHALQDAIQVEQANRGVIEVPSWDEDSQAKVRDALLILNETLPDLRRAAGRRGDVDPVRHLIVTASGWGANPRST